MPQRRPARVPGSLACQRPLQIQLQQRSQAINRRRKQIYSKTQLLYQRNLLLYLRNLVSQYRSSFISSLRARPSSLGIPSHRFNLH